MRTIYLSLCFKFLFLQAYCQDTIYQVNYSDGIGNSPASMFKVSNSEIYITGNRTYTTVTLTQLGEIVILKSNNNGTLLWQKSYYNDSVSLPFIGMIENTSNENLIFSNEVNTFSGGFYRNLIVSIDSSGNLLNAWRYVTVSGKSPQQPSLTKVANDFYVTGTTILNAVSQTINLSVFKTDSVHQPLWLHEYFTGYHFYDMKTTTSITNELVIVGSVSDTSHINIITWGLIAKCDTAGNMIWSYKYGGNPSRASFSDVKQLADGGFIVGGNNDGYPFLLKIDSLGAIVWSHTYSSGGGPFLRVSLTRDGGYIITDAAYNSPSFLTYLLKTDSLGNAEWAKSSGNSGHPVGIEQTADGGYLFVDYSGDNNSNSVIHVVKTDSLGGMGCYDFPFPVSSMSSLMRTPIPFTSVAWPLTMSLAIMQVDTIPLMDSVVCAGVSSLSSHTKNKKVLTLYPNPATTVCRIQAMRFTNALLKLYDVTGRVLLTKPFNEKAELNISSFANGVYVVELTNNQGERAQGKLLKND